MSRTGERGAAATKIIVLVALIALGVLAALFFQDMGRTKPKRGADADPAATGPVAPSWDRPESEVRMAAPPEAVRPKDIKPWEAPEVDPRTLPPGHLTPQQVGITPPDPVVIPPPPVPPPPPHLHTPPMHNPGGVNGDRPPRPVPGLDPPPAQ
jgi:hypothetical protein